MSNGKPEKKKGHPPLNLDLGDPSYRALAEYSARIRDLLTAPTAGANPDLSVSLDDLLGGVYALIQAKLGTGIETVSSRPRGSDAAVTSTF